MIDYLIVFIIGFTFGSAFMYIVHSFIDHVCNDYMSEINKNSIDFNDPEIRAMIEG